MRFIVDLICLLLAAAAVAQAAVTEPLPYDKCYCIDGIGVNVRESACGTVIGSATRGQAFKSRASRLTTCGIAWFSLDFNGRTAWVAGNYLNACADSNCVVTCPSIVSRSAWGARPPTRTTTISRPARYMFIHHTTGTTCSTQATCAAKVRGFQNYHMNTNGWSDIGYSFLVGNDGNIYEGTGWYRVGIHTAGYNSQGFAISFIGDFTNSLPSSAALSAAQRLIACGVRAGHLRTAYTLRGHRDMSATACPGTRLYNTIRSWPNYD